MRRVMGFVLLGAFILAMVGTAARSGDEPTHVSASSSLSAPPGSAAANSPRNPALTPEPTQVSTSSSLSAPPGSAAANSPRNPALTPR